MALAQRKLNVRTIAGVLLTVIGVVLTIVTVVHVVTFDPVKVTTLSIKENDKATFVYTSPGVINLVSGTPHVTITSSSHADIQWGYGSSDDVKAYVGASAAQELQGFGETLQEASVEVTKADAEAAAQDEQTIEAGGFALDQLDAWLKSGTAKGKAEFDLEVEQGVDRSLIATTADGKAPTVTISWTQEETTTSPAPFIVIGVLLALIGLVLLLTDWREQSQRIAVAKEQQHKRDLLAAKTSVLPAVKNTDLPYPDPQRDVHRENTGAALGAAIVPGSLRAHEFRDSELSHEDRLVVTENETSDEGSVSRKENATLWSYTEPFEKDSVDGEDNAYAIPVNDAWKGELHA